jgi:hypothetical protein
MTVYVYSVIVLSRVYVTVLRQTGPLSKDCYEIRIETRNLKSDLGQTKGYRTIDDDDDDDCDNNNEE